MPVIANDVGRVDIGFARGARFRWGCRWETSSDGGRTFQPVDLTAWTCVVRMYDQNDELILEKPCAATSSGGVAIAELTASDTLQDVWEGRRQGTWRVLASQSSGEALSVQWSGEQDASTSLLRTVRDIDTGDVELLGWGYWRCD